MKKEITGSMIYYYFVCKRKLWYSYNNISMEQTSENVAIGKIIDENTFQREDKHVQINNTISIDFIQGKLHEVKKSRKIEEASIWQVKYYLYYLKKHGVKDKTAIIHYPLLKQKLDVVLTKEDEDYLDEVIVNIEKITNSNIPLPSEKTRICKSCSYYDVCYI